MLRCVPSHITLICTVLEYRMISNQTVLIYLQFLISISATQYPTPQSHFRYDYLVINDKYSIYAFVFNRNFLMKMKKNIYASMLLFSCNFIVVSSVWILMSWMNCKTTTVAQNYLLMRLLCWKQVISCMNGSGWNFRLTLYKISSSKICTEYMHSMYLYSVSHKWNRMKAMEHCPFSFIPFTWTFLCG